MAVNNNAKVAVGSIGAVGSTGRGYPEERNIWSVPLERYKVQFSPDLFSVAKVAYKRVSGRNSPSFLKSWHIDFGLNKCDVLHFFNTISFGPTPWVVTFERMVPKAAGRAAGRIGLSQLKSRACRRIIAMSECAKRWQESLFAEAKGYESTAEKLIVLHPPQPLLVSDYDAKPLSDEISITIVGNDFFRKGGREVVAVFDELVREGAPLKLNVVSTLRCNNADYLLGDRDCEDVRAAIERHGRRISLYQHIPNAHVTEILKATDIAMLPTFFDSYGYSVLEAQASGCPILTTNIMVMPEINNNEIGWVVDLPIGPLGPTARKDREAKTEYSEIIKAGIRKALTDVLHDRSIVRAKAVGAMARIKAQHDPYTYAAMLERIYDSARN